ncbi:MAG: two-component regulator propeller domain-containing protein, partial [Rhodothermales bacterium]|nr:two-component regulator propeller domain-containing protein [Rhodothermales bacterium]
GLHRVDASVGQFPHYTSGPTDFDNATRAMAEDRSGQLWLGSSSGVHLLARTDRRGERYSYRGEVPPQLGAVRIQSLLFDRAGLLWIGTWEQGLYRYNPGTNGLTHFDVSEPGFESLAGITVTALYEDEEQILWLGTRTQGLFKYDSSSGSLTAFTHDPEDPSSLAQNSIRCLFETRDGALWVGSEGGLSTFDRSSGKFRTFSYEPDDPSSLSDNVVTAVWEDVDGRLWIGTESGGLNRLDRETGAFLRLSTVDSGLPADGVLGITEDDQGFLWISTDRGLTRLNPVLGTFDTFGSDYGLPAEPFYTGSVLRNADGRLFFGGRNGFHTFLPESISREHDVTPPQVAITELSLFGQHVDPGPESPLAAAISVTESLDLSHSQNDVTFKFAAMHFRRPTANQYSYLLDPYQASWSTPGFGRTASYTNLDPGDYVFRVRAASSDGVWSEQDAVLTMTIHPPFWATWWFRVLALTLVIAVVGGSYHIRVRQIHERNRRLQELVTERTRELEHSLQLLTKAQDQLVHADKMASLGQLVAGVAHELKNPLNFVNNFAELSSGLVDELRAAVSSHGGGEIEDLNASIDPIIEDLTQNVRRINEHGSRADSIIRSMLDHSRGQPGERVPTDLNALLRQYVSLAYHGMRARHAGFNATFETDYDNAVGDVSVVPQEIGRVFINLLNNALDALQIRQGAEPGFEPVVSIETRRRDDLVEIRIADNGPGIPADVHYK